MTALPDDPTDNRLEGRLNAPSRLEGRLNALGGHLRHHWRPWLLAVSLTFLWLPGIDITVSGWFFAPPTEPLGGWWLHDTPYGTLVLRGLFPLMLALLLAVGWRAWLGKRGVRPAVAWASGASVRYLVVSLIVGPGLIVNTLLKDHWGRARPVSVQQFGGAAHFTPPLVVSDQCLSNCSFPSGHAALGFWLVSFALLAPLPWRGRAVAASLAFGSLIGVTRIAQGGHFLSDVIASGIIVLAVSWGLRWRMVPDYP